MNSRAPNITLQHYIDSVHPASADTATTSTGDTLGHADLAARRPGEDLAQCDQVGVAAVVQPAPALNELGAEVPQVRNRATK